MIGEEIKALAKIAYCDDEGFEEVWQDGDFRTFCAALLHAYARPEALCSEWRTIETAPKDGSAIFLLSAAHDQDCGPDNGVVHCPPKCHIGSWNPEGDSWVNEHGQLGGDCYTLAVTGTWSSGGGWFEPNEVTHWMPLPSVPSPLARRQEEKS